jgi:hypothetical protein
MLWLAELLYWCSERWEPYCHWIAVAVRRDPQTGDWSPIDRFGSTLATPLFNQPYHLNRFGFLVAQEPGEVAVQLWGIRKIWRGRFSAEWDPAIDYEWTGSWVTISKQGIGEPML